MRVAAVSNCERLGKYHMPFAWTAIHLVDIISGKQASTDAAAAAAATGPSQEKETTPAGNLARKVINPNVDKLHLLNMYLIQNYLNHCLFTSHCLTL